MATLVAQALVMMKSKETQRRATPLPQQPNDPSLVFFLRGGAYQLGKLRLTLSKYGDRRCRCSRRPCLLD